jgi:ADP-ribose pyrophosphatase YjhB (NUDIX family)
MNIPVTNLLVDGRPVKISWFSCQDREMMDKYQPVTQVYGVCFDRKGDILVINEGNNWKIPGGTIETGETLEQTLERELTEEADITIENAIPVGIQLIEDPENSRPDRRRHYQARFACKIKSVQEQTIDPATGAIPIRKFVKKSNIFKTVLWGDTGNALFKEAIALWNLRKNS